MVLLITWVAVFALIAIPVVATHAWISAAGETDERILVGAPLIALGLLGALMFLAFFIHPVVGFVLSFGSELTLATYLFLRQKNGFPWRAEIFEIPGLLIFSIGLFNLALLYLPNLGREPEWQSQVRFLYEFPPDANLPKLLGDRLYSGESPKPFLPESGWLSSDRPPLQSGIYLLVRPWLSPLGIPAGFSYQCVGTLCQFIWIPAVWLIGRKLRLKVLPTTTIILLMAASGFVLFNSTYVWPKLLSGGFVLLAATLLLDRTEARTPETAVLGGAAAALGWLSHGGAAFSLVTLGMILLIPPWFLGRKKTLLAAVAFAVLVLPWSAYQKFYDPPANRLLKWHLAGVIPIDSRSTPEAMADSYGALSHDALVANKSANFHTLFNGSFWDTLDIFTTPLRKRRVDEFFYIFRSLGILNLAWLVAPVMWLVRRRLPEFFELQGLMLAWTALTLVLWAALMFIPSSTLLHQGPYAAMISLFLLAVL
ncbi:MAG: hypothetical protein JWM35_488, partial [Verrucomicrobia bacterium]|nr:hypothetical protein [Verrucomicrobiota bacterium]